ncbi:synaptotagmin-6-like isoform X2 [Lineus longissimus]|uniref:synaptotagmin-6-like isoform X2 n=1 Tax=Lineus longissimus TaxID=88925 RepID=UPI00315D666C
MVSAIILGVVCGVSGGVVVVVSLVLCRYFLYQRKVKASAGTSDVSVEGSGQYIPSRAGSYMQVSSEFRVSKESLNVQPRPIPTIQKERLKESPTESDTVSLGACSTNSANSSGFDVPLGSIRPDLYQRKDAVLRQESRDSIVRLGRLHIRVKYDFNTSDLVVHVIEAQDLPPVDTAGLSDPYVKLVLSPEIDTKLRQTSLKRRTINPVFDEYFKFPVTFEDLADRTISFFIYNYDKFSRHDVIGCVSLDLAQVDVSTSLEIWSDVQKHEQTESDLGELLVSLSYLPSAERLTVVIMKAQDLKMAEMATASSSSDPFVRVSLSVNGKKIKKKKTAVRKNTRNPVWNEALVFNVPAEMLPRVALEIAVMDYDLLGHNELVGMCVISQEGLSAGAKHWTDMTGNFRKAIAMWHSLKRP